MNNQDSLRSQIIEALTPRLGQGVAASVFQHDLWPVLDAAMKAGELLVHRATTPQKPVHEALVEWLEGCCGVIALMHSHEATVPKAQLMKTLYQLEAGAAKALADARAINKNGTLSGATLVTK